MEEARALVQDVERVMIADQIHAYTHRRWPGAESYSITRICGRNAFRRFTEPIAFEAEESARVPAR